MENESPNVPLIEDHKNLRPRFSLISSSSRRPSLLTRSILSPRKSPFGSPSSVGGDSSDGEWTAIQQTVNESKKLNEAIADRDGDEKSQDHEDGDANFISPDLRRKKMSLGTIRTQREGLSLARQSMELDDEIEFMEASMEVMEENFKTMFSQITQRRIMHEKEAKEDGKASQAPVKCFEAIESLDLHGQPHLEWAGLMEKQVESVMK